MENSEKKWTVEESKKVVRSCTEKLGEKFINKKNGNEYTFMYPEIHSETLEPMISYLDKDGDKWTRPYFLFYEKFYKKQANTEAN